MKNLVFHPNSEEHSVAIQTRLFQLGYYWPKENGTNIAHLEAKRIYAYSDGRIKFKNEPKKLKEGFEEGSLDALYGPDIKPMGGIVIGGGLRLVENDDNETYTVFYGRNSEGIVTKDEAASLALVKRVASKFNVNVTVNKDGDVNVSRTENSCKSVDADLIADAVAV